jgi:hypothetical protein
LFSILIESASITAVPTAVVPGIGITGEIPEKFV